MSTIKYMLSFLMHDLSIFSFRQNFSITLIFMATTCTYEKYINYKNIELNINIL